jgi:hypothetical protein
MHHLRQAANSCAKTVNIQHNIQRPMDGRQSEPDFTVFYRSLPADRAKLLQVLDSASDLYQNFTVSLPIFVFRGNKAR